MSDEDTQAQTMLADAVNADQKPANQDGKSTTTTKDTATASPWDELGSFEDVKKQLSHARQWEKRAKDNADAAKRLADIEESRKTESQKLTDRVTAAEKELGEYRVREIRQNAAREAGLDLDMAQFLTESEPESALKQAKVLAKKLNTVRPDLKQGARPSAKEPQDMNAWLRRQAGYAP